MADKILIRKIGRDPFGIVADYLTSKEDEKKKMNQVISEINEVNMLYLWDFHYCYHTKLPFFQNLVSYLHPARTNVSRQAVPSGDEEELYFRPSPVVSRLSWALFED